MQKLINKNSLNVILFCYFISLGIMAQDFKVDPATSLAIPTYLGTVTLLKGRANVQFADGKSALLMLDQKVRENDKITTSEDTVVKITMNMVDNTKIIIGPNSEFICSKHSISKDGKATIYEFVRGRFRASFEASQNDSRDINYGKKNVSMGIRGTEVLSNVDDKEIVVGLLSGKGEIKAKGKTKSDVLLPGKFIKYTNIDKLEEIISKIENMPEEDLIALRGNPDAFLKNYGISTSTDSTDGSSSLEKSSNDKDDKEKTWKDTLKELNKKLSN